MDNIPFPQADDFNKVVRIMEISSEDNLSDFQFMSAYLDGISDRQVSYYLSAAAYIGLIDKTKHFTELGNRIRKMNTYSRIVEYIRLLMSDPVFGKVYIAQKVLAVTYELEDVAEVIREFYPDYCEPIYKRRGQTVLSWIKWINDQMNQEL